MADNLEIGDVVHAMSLPAAMIGPDARIFAYNAGFACIFGDGFMGRHFITVLRQPDLIDAIETVFAGGTPMNATLMTRISGQDASFDVHAAKTGDLVIVSLVDRTDVEQMEKMRTDFIANVSHELRTPLTALSGFIETLRGAARHDPAAQDRFLRIMETEAARMTRLVDELMTLSKLEGTQRQRPTDQVDIGEVVRLVQNTLGPIADAAGVAVDVDLPPAPVVVLGDAAQLQQVFTNLVENAIKYGGSGKRVEITVGPHTMQPRLRTQGTAITIQDFGDGIAAHHIARLTERFYRVDSHRSREVGGTGLGLAIVKHILNRHRGRLKFESTVGQGTTAVVTLPQK